MPIEQIKLTIPFPAELGGPTDLPLGRWVWNCKPATSEFRATNLALFEGELEVSLEKVQKAAGLLGKLVKDKQLDEFIKQTKELVPRGSAYFSISLLADAYKSLCPTDQTCATTVGFSVKIQFMGRLSAAAGVVSGGARAAVAIELAGDDKECDCCKEESSGAMLTPDEQEALLPASGTTDVTAPDAFSSRPTTPQRPAKPSQPKSHHEATAEPRQYVATVTAKNIDTGEIRTIGQIPYAT